MLTLVFIFFPLSDLQKWLKSVNVPRGLHGDTLINMRLGAGLDDDGGVPSLTIATCPQKLVLFYMSDLTVYSAF